MVLSVLTLLAGALALVGIFAIVRAAMTRSDAANHTAVRVAQVSLTLSGVSLFVSAFVGGEMMNLFGGVMLVIFGTGMSAVRRRTDRVA